MGNKIKHSRTAKIRGEARRRRKHRASHREATKEVREKINAKRRDEGHPGWVHNEPWWW